MKRILMPGTNEAKRLKERKTVQTNAVKLRDQAILEMLTATGMRSQSFARSTLPVWI